MGTSSADPRAESGAHLSRRRLLRGTVGTGLLAVTAAGLALGTSGPAQAAQNGWRWCNLCSGLWFGGGGPGSNVCPASKVTGTHSAISSGNYVLKDSSDGGEQYNWRWCSRCMGLWFAGNGTAGACPAGGGHRQSGSGNYVLNFYPDGGGTQHNWRWCSFCQGLWFQPASQSCCPVNGFNGHTDAGSGDYYLINN
jgi:hypothetical protein